MHFDSFNTDLGLCSTAVLLLHSCQHAVMYHVIIQSQTQTCYMDQELYRASRLASNLILVLDALTTCCVTGSTLVHGLSS